MENTRLAVKFKDYYETLGVSRQATEQEIKGAYRKLARKFHPDANKGTKGSEEKFKEIGEAYEVLKDPEKRRRYDMLGANYKAGADFRPPPGAGGANFDFGNLGGMGGNSSFSDFFEMLFGQSMAGQGSAPNPFSGAGAFGGAGTFAGQSRTRASRQPARHEAEIELTIEEMAKGTTRTLEITAPGASAKQVEVKIPAGVRPGSKVRVAGGKTGADGADIYLTVKAKPHSYFTLDGNHLLCELNLLPSQAVLGTEVTVTTLDGPKTVKVPAGSQAGRTLRLRGRGLPGMKGAPAGDQLVKIKIVIPTKPTAEELKLYEQLAKLESKD